MTTPTDGGSGTDTGTTPEDSSTTPMDSGTPTEAGPACTTDASVVIGVDTDAGFMPNATCSACINTSCGMAACPCLTDTNTVALDDAGDVTTACGAYVGCVYQALATFLAANPDAGGSGEAQALAGAESSCQTGLMTPASSETSGKGLISCVAAMCLTQCAP